MAKNKNYHPDQKKSAPGTRKTYSPTMDRPDEVIDLTPGWLKAVLAVMLIGTVTLLVLRKGVLANVSFIPDLIALMVGLTSLVLFVIRYYYPSQRTESRFQKVLTVALGLLGALYTVIGAVGLVGMMG